MTSPNQPDDLLNFDEDRKKLPDMLNVLTILTFIGCGTGLISSIYAFVNAQKSYDDMVKVQSNMENAPEIVKKMAGPHMVELAEKSLENRIPILILSLVGYGLCVYGAIRMRKLKKEGFSFYALGEILPIIGGFIFVGMGLLGGFTLFVSLAFPALFLILYGTQLKHLS
jgi:hypothetical protein